jgi:flagellar capping protein FliD
MLNQLALISSRIFFKAKTSLSKLMQEVQMKSHEQATSFTSRKALSSSQEVWQASSTSNKEHLLQSMYFISQISALACSSSSTHVE